MEKIKKRAWFFLCLAIGLMLVSMVATNLILTDFGRVRVTKLKQETDDGYTMSALLFQPKVATADNPAPAVVTSHGSLNNKEMMDMSFVELARRGFVVLAVDQPSHGNSDNVKKSQNTAVYQGALLLSRLPYVDSSRIGATGHSMGGISCKNAVLLDYADGSNDLIVSLFLNSSAPAYKDDAGNYANVYGDIDIGLLAGKYDEFGFSSTSATGEKLLAPYFDQSADYQSFLHFGQDPAGLDKREAGVFYTDENGNIRVAYTPAIIHPWAHFSKRAAAGLIEFFDASLDAPVKIAPTNQVWNVKEAFNFVGVIGFVMFLAAFAVLMVYTPFFGSLRATEPAKPRMLATTGDKLIAWGSLIISAAFSCIIFVPTLLYGFSKNVSQKQALGMGLWSTYCGLFAIAVMALYYFFWGKKRGFDLKEAGIILPFKQVLKTILLALIVICVGYTWVFIADYFFNTDFRLWCLGIKAVEPDKIYRTIPYMWHFIIFYLASSVASNCFNYNSIGGKHEWVNNVIVSLFVTAPALILPWIQYGTYVATNQMVWTNMYAYLSILWLFPVVEILFLATFMSRYIYKATKNPYIAGIINGVIIALMTTSNTWMYFAYKA